LEISNLTIWFGQPYRHDASSSYDEKQVYSVVNHNTSKWVRVR